MVTLAPMECALSVTRNICRDNKEGGETVPQVIKVNQSPSILHVKCTYCIQNLIRLLSFKVKKNLWLASCPSLPAATSPVGSPGASAVTVESTPVPPTEAVTPPEERTSR